MLRHQVKTRPPIHLVNLLKYARILDLPFQVPQNIINTSPIAVSSKDEHMARIMEIADNDDLQESREQFRSEVERCGRDKGGEK